LATTGMPGCEVKEHVSGEAKQSMDDDACSLSNTERETDTRHLFEDCAWLYAFCREHLFRDHTNEIAQALFPDGVSSGSKSVLEVGCGPGFYARQFAQRYPALQVLGLDRSLRLIAWAQWRASSDALANCRFQQGNVESLSTCVDAVDAVISSRLLLVVNNRAAVISEIFRVLKPGGRLFLAEPTANFKTQLPLSAMRLITYFMRSATQKAFPRAAMVLTSRDFEDLICSQPWGNVSIQMYGDYQCAICEKSDDAVMDVRGMEMPGHSIPLTSSRSFA
jgi:arsenite methyltransferase